MTSALCLHGWGYKKDMFSFLSLNDRLEKITTPCLYETAKQIKDDSLSALANVLASNITENTVVFGWSLGGAIALNMLGLTDKIKALVFIASSPVFVNKLDWQYSANKNEFNSLRLLFDEKPNQALKQFNVLSMLGEKKDKEAAQKTMQYLAEKKHRSILQSWLDELNQADYRNIINNLNIPALMFFGEKDALLNPDTVNQINNHFVETHIIKDCGHAPFVNHSEEMLGVIKVFFDRHGI